MSRDIVDMIDGAIADYELIEETGTGDAMRWSPEPEKAQQDQQTRLHASPLDARRHQRHTHVDLRRPERQPVIQQAAPGMRLVPFVGGYFHGDIRAVALHMVERRESFALVEPIPLRIDWVFEDTDRVPMPDLRQHYYHAQRFTLQCNGFFPGLGRAGLYSDVAYVHEGQRFNEDTDGLLMEVVLDAITMTDYRPREWAALPYGHQSFRVNGL